VHYRFLDDEVICKQLFCRICPAIQWPNIGNLPHTIWVMQNKNTRGRFHQRFRARFLYERLFSSYVLVMSKKSARKTREKTLVKSTPGGGTYVTKNSSFLASSPSCCLDIYSTLYFIFLSLCNYATWIFFILARFYYDFFIILTAFSRKKLFL